jgi:hypothetical protein
MKRNSLARLFCASALLFLYCVGHTLWISEANAQTASGRDTIAVSTECASGASSKRGKVIGGEPWRYEIRSVAKNEVWIYGLLNNCYLVISSESNAIQYLDHANDRFALEEFTKIEIKYSKKIAPILRREHRKCRMNVEAYFSKHHEWKQRLDPPPPDLEEAPVDLEKNPNDISLKSVCRSLVFGGFLFEVFTVGERRLAVVILTGVATTIDLE